MNTNNSNKYSKLNKLNSEKSPLFTAKSSSNSDQRDRLELANLKSDLSYTRSEQSLSIKSDDNFITVAPRNRILSPQKILSILYFCNQRLTIFIAPVLISQGFPESQIGIVIFISGMIGILAQTPAGQIIDESDNKKAFLFGCNLLTALFSLPVIYSSRNFWFILLCETMTICCESFTFPTLYSMTLGIVGQEGIGEQAPINESCQHLGNTSFAIMAGFVVIFTTQDLSILYVIVFMRALSCMLLLLIQDGDIDFYKARGLAKESADEPAVAPISFRELFSDFYLRIYFITVTLFHFCNAAMLPMLTQKLYLINPNRGFECAALALIISKACMVVSVQMGGMLAPKMGTKPLFLFAMICLPIRGFFIVTLLTVYPHTIPLLGTQVLDGMGDGMFQLMAVLLAENLTRGTGRFAFVYGISRACQVLGGSFSNLTGQAIAEYYGYTSAFLFLSVFSFIPLISYFLTMPSASIKDNGKIEDELSICSSHHKNDSLRGIVLNNKDDKTSSKE